jgi:hypothetical protein
MIFSNIKIFGQSYFWVGVIRRMCYFKIKRSEERSDCPKDRLR